MKSIIALIIAAALATVSAAAITGCQVSAHSNDQSSHLTETTTPEKTDATVFTTQPDTQAVTERNIRQNRKSTRASHVSYDKSIECNGSFTATKQYEVITGFSGMYSVSE